MSLYYEDAGLRLFHGSNLDVLPTFEGASFDSIITDPPYELGFMGKKWDSSGIAYNVDLWRECFRVLKPGGFLLAFGGTRTWHRIAAAIEDAGFEIRDSIAWMYGSGFPKSMNVARAIDLAGGASPAEQATVLRQARERAGMSRADVAARVGCTEASVRDWEEGRARAIGRAVEHIVPSAAYRSKLADLLGYTADERMITGTRADRRGDGSIVGLGHSGAEYGAAVTDAAREWEGWGTALKPAFEPIVVARKPLAGTVAANVLEHGTGALNIDACRVGDSGGAGEFLRADGETGSVTAFGDGLNGTKRRADSKQGRFPPNVLLDESQAAELDRQAPDTGGAGKASGPTLTGASTSVARGKFNGVEDSPFYGDRGGASRFFPTFRYVAKAPSSERPEVDGTVHATVKPLDLMRWLIRLVTRRGGSVLDPFAGSGTTGEAALLEGMTVDLIELEDAHLPLILQRVRKPLQPSMFGDWDEEEAS